MSSHLTAIRGYGQKICSLRRAQHILAIHNFLSHIFHAYDVYMASRETMLRIIEEI